MKRILSFFLMGILGLGPSLFTLSSCSTTGNNAAQSPRKNGADEKRAEEIKVDILLMPFVLALLPLEIIPLLAQDHKPADRNPSSKSKSQLEPPVNPLPQTSS